MKNREKYRDEIKRALKEGKVYAFMSDHLADYNEYETAEYSNIRFMFWLDEEYTEPEIDPFNEFMTALPKCDTVKVILTGCGESTFATKEIYEGILKHAKLAEVKDNA